MQTVNQKLEAQIIRRTMPINQEQIATAHRIARAFGHQWATLLTLDEALVAAIDGVNGIELSVAAKETEERLLDAGVSCPPNPYDTPCNPYDSAHMKWESQSGRWVVGIDGHGYATVTLHSVSVAMGDGCSDRYSRDGHMRAMTPVGHIEVAPDGATRIMMNSCAEPRHLEHLEGWAKSIREAYV